jgi:hypothetical protein
MESRNEPIYRPIVREAFLFSWKEKRLWIIAIIAGMLMTGSVFDVILRSADSLATESSLLGVIIPFWHQTIGTWSHFSIADLIVGSLQVMVTTGFFLLFVFTFFCASVIAQGTIVHAIGSSRRGKNILLTDSLRIGSRSLWPVFVLNLISLAMLLACRSLIAIAFTFSLQVSSGFSFFVYLVCFIAFTLLALATFIVQIFATNAMILQGATLAQAVTRGIEILKRHWITSAEVTALLFLISIGLLAMTVAGGMLLSVPFVICFAVSIFAGSQALFVFVTILFLILYLILCIISAGFTILLHYSVWTSLFRAFGEGGVLPKIHRIARAFTHQSDIPGNS